MAKSELFLINPVRRRRSRSGVRKRTVRAKRRTRRSGGLPSDLLKRMIRQHGQRKGMKEAWKQYRMGHRNPRLTGEFARRRKVHRPRLYDLGAGKWRRSPLSRSRAAGITINPRRRRRVRQYRKNFGEEVMIVGNPRRRRKRAKRRTSAKRRHLPAIFERNPVRQRRRRRSYGLRRNPIFSRRRSRRRYRRNPMSARSAGLPSMDIRRPMSLIVPLAVGTGGFIGADYVPAMIGLSGNNLTRLVAKLGTGILGRMVIGKFAGRTNGTIFMIGAGINLFQDLLRTFIFTSAVAPVETAGVGAFPYQNGGYAGMGAYSNEYSDLGSEYSGDY